jgi:hypothetical protein
LPDCHGLVDHSRAGRQPQKPEEMPSSPLSLQSIARLSWACRSLEGWSTAAETRRWTPQGAPRASPPPAPLPTSFGLRDAAGSGKNSRTSAN